MQADYAAYANRDQVLPMPPGYTTEAQINANALRENFLPQTKRLLPELLAILGVIAALFWFVRRRRA